MLALSCKSDILKETSLDITVCKCPECGNFFAEPSWFVHELEQDFECGVCKTIFNTKKAAVSMSLIEFKLDSKGNIIEMKRKKSLY